MRGNVASHAVTQRERAQLGPRQPQQPACLPCNCTGGHGTVPYEQKTQQSPGLGRSTVWHCSHS